MTRKTEVSVVVERPPEDLWKYVTSDRMRSGPDVIDWKRTSAGPFGVGTTFREMRSKTPKVMDFRVTECEPNMRIGLEIISGPIRGTKITWGMESIEGKTRLTETANYNFSGIFKLIGPFYDRPGKAEREGMTRLNTIKHAMESEAKP